ncbi:unnamed protein product [Discosporangium mesarthrocarpum]
MRAYSITLLSCGLHLLACQLHQGDASEATVQPNILLVVVDDLGYHDVGFHDPAFSTPNIDRMVSEGVELSSFYTSALCTPTRSQLMTGRYNHRTGMQDAVLFMTEPRGVPLEERFIGEKLRDAGYSTALVGKWHLGMHMAVYTPNHRGFDRFYGMLPSHGSQFTHESRSPVPFVARKGTPERIFRGVNLVEDGQLSDDNYEHIHTTDLYTTKAAEYLEAMVATGNPWFLDLSYQAIHDPMEEEEMWFTGNSCDGIGKDLDSEINPEVDLDNRRIVCGMMAHVDDSLGQIRLLLTKLGQWDNTVLLFMSDNGGALRFGSRNYPFRGAKRENWEGGVHVPAFVSGGYLTSALSLGKVKPYVYSHLTHVTDIHATALGLAGVTSEEGLLDGVDFWDSLVTQGGAARESVVISVHSPYFGESSAVRSGNFKLMQNPAPVPHLVYRGVRNELSENGLVASRDVLANVTAKVLERLGLSEPDMYLIDLDANPREDTSGTCGDPIEACSNLYGNPRYAAAQEELEAILESAKENSVPTDFLWADDGPLADPANFGGWLPWRDDDGTPLALYFEGTSMSSSVAGAGDQCGWT